MIGSHLGEPGFRRDIEGLRAVAVGLVVLYHADIPGFTGGYIGVDVFYVISGFLITRLLVDEIGRTDTVSLREFYARRIRRIPPAAAVVLVATTIAGLFVLSPLEAAALGRDAQAAALYVVNFRFAIQGLDYLQLGRVSALQHYWSLAVEEQFYMVWPIIVLGLSKLRSSKHLRTFVLGAIFIGSLASCIQLTELRQPWAFFLLPSRAWELLVGATLAIHREPLARLPRRAGGILAVAGLVSVIAAGAVFDDRTAFPGVAALVPVLGAAAVIAGGMSQTARPGVLGLRPMQLIGRWSYSIYLWHWPLLIFPRQGSTGPLPVGVRAGLAIASIALAAATYRAIEDPIRRSRRLHARSERSLALGAAITAMTLIAGTAVAMTEPPVSKRRALETPTDLTEALRHPTLYTPPNLIPPLRDAHEDYPRTYEDKCHVLLLSTRSTGCNYAVRDASESVFLVGDSHAAQWFPALEVIAKRRGWRLVNMTKSSCPFATVTLYEDALERTYTECDEWRSKVIDRIRQERPVVVIQSNFSYYEPDPKIRDVGAWWAEGLRRTIVSLEDDTRSIVLSDTPLMASDIPFCLSRNSEDALLCATPRSDAVDDERITLERATVTAAGGTFVDTTGWACPGPTCFAVAGNLLMYTDRHHLSTRAAAAFAGQLDDVISQVTDG